MHSRLYTRVLNQYAWVQSCSAFQSTFNNTGLIGISAACDPRYAPDMLDVMCRELETVTRCAGDGDGPVYVLCTVMFAACWA
eukprot:1153006-Pelagomonas_calceolata.AAC.2